MKFLVVCSNFGDFLYCFFPLANVNVIIQRKSFPLDLLQALLTRAI